MTSHWDDPEVEAAEDAEAERERLREVLGFPEPAEPAETSPPPVGATDAEVAEPDPLALRVDQLSRRVEALAGLVEALFDRLDSPSARERAAVTSDDVADLAARMVQLVEARMAEHGERLEATLRERSSTAAAGAADHREHLAQLDDHLTLVARAVLDVKKAVVDLQHAPADPSDSAATATVDRWFEEVNTRLATEVADMRSDVQRCQHAVMELSAQMLDLAGLISRRDAAPASDAEQRELRELREAIAALPQQVAMQQPLHRLDSAILQQIELQLDETSAALARKVEDQLGARVQRFEALSQSMITLAGEPIDTLTTRLRELAALRAPDGELAALIAALQDLVRQLGQST